MLNIEKNVTVARNGVKYMMTLAGICFICVYEFVCIARSGYRLKAKKKTKNKKQKKDVNVGDSRLPYLPMTTTDKQMMSTGVKNWCSQTNNVVSWCANL